MTQGTDILPERPELDSRARLVTQAELARRWRMSGRTLERWRAERYGPLWIRIGGRILYRLEDILAYEDRQRSDRVR